jgi:hypothetical protein
MTFSQSVVKEFTCEDCGAIIKRGFLGSGFAHAYCENCYRVYIKGNKWIRCHWTLFEDSHGYEFKEDSWVVQLVEQLTSYR